MIELRFRSQCRIRYVDISEFDLDCGSLIAHNLRPVDIQRIEDVTITIRDIDCHGVTNNGRIENIDTHWPCRSIVIYAEPICIDLRIFDDYTVAGVV